MNDTPADVDARYRALLLARPGAERVRMGCSMYAAAKALVLASIHAADPRASPAAVRRALFLRVYGRDFDPAAREKILAALGGE